MSVITKDLGAATAYAYAVEKGYTGTEAEFAELMADYAEVGQRAEDAAESALNSKTAAQTAATTATNKASEATTAAQAATTKAGEASTSASTATSAKDTAVSASQTATSKATEATTAAATATSAASTATTAKDDAVSAKTAAQTAQTGAESARDAVQLSAAQITTNAEDITQLKEGLNVSIGILPYTKIANSGINASGVIASLSGSTRTDYIDITAESYLWFINLDGAADYNAFYDANKTFISRFTIPANAELFRVSVPDDAVYLILSARNNQHISTMYKSGAFSSLGDMKSDIASLQNDTLYIPDMDYALRYNKYYLSGHFVHGSIGSSGTVSYSDTYKYQVISDKMLYAKEPIKLIIANGYKVRLTFYSSSTMTSTYFVSQTNNYNGEVTIPANSYFTVTINTDPTSSVETDITTLAHSVFTYVATPIDSIIDQVGNAFDFHSLPAYWRTEIEAKMATILAKDALIGNNGDSFVFITDIHMPRNSLHSPALIKYIMSHSSVNRVFCGGDLLDIDTGDNGKATAEARIAKWHNLMNGTDEFYIIGNHDNNNFNNTNSTNAFSVPGQYGLYIKPIEKFHNTNRSTSYVIDNVSQKTRYIVLDCENSGYGDVLIWMESKLTELEAGWSVIIMQHRYWATTTATVDSVGTQLVTAINSVYAQLNCTIVAVIVGHTHTDYNITDSTNGYPIIAVNCDTKEGSISGYTRTAGTISEQSFDVVHIDYTNRKIYMTRIGAGSNREFSY